MEEVFHRKVHSSRTPESLLKEKLQFVDSMLGPPRCELVEQFALWYGGEPLGSSVFSLAE